VSGGSDGRGSRPRLRKLPLTGWVLQDLHIRMEGMEGGLALTERQKQRRDTTGAAYRREAAVRACSNEQEGSSFIAVHCVGATQACARRERWR
jgi:hypothetical protein